MNKELKKKLWLDIRLTLILMPMLYYGALSSPLLEEPLITNMNPLLGGLLTGWSWMLVAYLVLSWLFYDKYKKLIK